MRARWGLAVIAVTMAAPPQAPAAKRCSGKIAAANGQAHVVRVNRKVADLCDTVTGRRYRVRGDEGVSGFRTAGRFVLFERSVDSGVAHVLFDVSKGTGAVIGTDTSSQFVAAEVLLRDGRTVVGSQPVEGAAPAPRIAFRQPGGRPVTLARGDLNPGSIAVAAPDTEHATLYYLDAAGTIHTERLAPSDADPGPASQRHPRATGACAGRVLAAAGRTRVLSGKRGPVLCRGGERTALGESATSFVVRGRWVMYETDVGLFSGTLRRADARTGVIEEISSEGKHVGYSLRELLGDGTIVFSFFGEYPSTIYSPNQVIVAPVGAPERVLSDSASREDRLDPLTLAVSEAAGVAYWMQGGRARVSGFR